MLSIVTRRGEHRGFEGGTPRLRHLIKHRSPNSNIHVQ
jgi:hypothetical protein